jgi:hypothetical protein
MLMRETDHVRWRRLFELWEDLGLAERVYFYAKAKVHYSFKPIADQSF